MNTYEPSYERLPRRNANLLFMQWVEYLLQRDFGLDGQSFGGNMSATARIPSEYAFSEDGPRRVTLRRTPNDLAWSVESEAIDDPDQIDALLSAALASANELKSGEDICYVTGFNAPKPEMDAAFATHLARGLGDTVLIDGKRRLGRRAILTFETPPAEGQAAFFGPDTKVKLALFVPGPSAGLFSAQIAHVLSEEARMLCVFATGRAIRIPAFAPVPELLGSASEHFRDREDPSILDLAREGKSLDFVEGHTSPREAFGYHERLRGSLAAFDAALAQDRADVATILLVTAIEALIAPDQKWAQDRVTARFQHAVFEICPDAVDAVVDHGNVEEAFEWRKKGARPRLRKDVLSRIYELRSLPVHTGLATASHLMDGVASSPAKMRVALLSELYRSFLLAFTEAPRSFLVGQPGHSAGDSFES